MPTTIKLNAQGDHVIHWVQLKRLYVKERGSDAGRNDKAIPRTTNDDVKQLTRWWHDEYLRELRRSPFAADRSKSSRKEWTDSKRKIDDDLEGSDPAALYRDNEWFWERATRRLSLYLNSRKVVPSEISLFVESVKETVEERIEDLADLADATDQLGSILKKGLLIAGGAAAALIIIPPMIRAFTDKEER